MSNKDNMETVWRQKLENAVAVVAINTHQGALQSGLR